MTAPAMTGAAADRVADPGATRSAGEDPSGLLSRAVFALEDALSEAQGNEAAVVNIAAARLLIAAAIETL